jgi:Family of unknown function (DUF5946)
VPDIEGPTHRYIGASAGCWAIYGEVIEKEYGNHRYAPAHRLTADAYPVQHPGVPSPQAIRSVAVHLVALCLQLERGLLSEELYAARQRVANLGKRGALDLRWLDPPATLGELTVLHVRGAQNPEEHTERVGEWARSVWEAWSPYHDTVRRWADA